MYIAPLITKTWNCRSQATFVAFVGNNWNKGKEKGPFLFHCNLGADRGRCGVAEGAKGQVSFPLGSVMFWKKLLWVKLSYW